MLLESIRPLITDDLAAVDRAIMRELKSNIPLIGQITEHILLAGGKRIRPTVLLLSARALSYTGDQHIDLAAVIELIHTATLLHDDVVDNTTLRRGHQTAHAIWGSASSVLVGDFLYSRAFQKVVELHHQTILDIFAKATHYIAEGEMLQLMHCRNPDMTLELYFDVIQRKTAKLFEVATELGAIISGSSATEITALRDYCNHLCLAYQLIDDTLDYSQSAQAVGKDVGQDLLEGKVTLPLIYAMQKSESNDLQLLRQAVQSGSADHLGKILDIVNKTGAIQSAQTVAKYHAEEAKNALSSIAISPYRDALRSMSDFVIARTY